jgi:hypothetical protein
MEDGMRYGGINWLNRSIIAHNQPAEQMTGYT